jgi:hypothetical protein
MEARRAAAAPQQWFYFAGSLLLVAVISYGFSRTIGKRLFDASHPAPAIVWAHGVAFFSWLALLVTQSTLVRTGNVRIHRALGRLGVIIGISIPILGMATGILMGRRHIAAGDDGVDTFFAVICWDMLAFTLLFVPAVLLRKRPEYHRRLMFLATCVLAGAGFGRFPTSILPEDWMYVGVDALIVLGMVRDLVVLRRVHPVYLWAFPPLLAGQMLAMHLYLSANPQWIAIARAILT